MQPHSVAKPFPSNCGSLDLFFADFSMILRIFSPIFSQQKKRKKKRRDVREETMQAYPGLLTSQKSRSYRYWNRRSSRQNCFTVDTRDRKMTWRQERASYAAAGRYSRYHCFIVHHFAGKTVFCGSSKIHDPLPATSTASLDSRVI